MTVSKTRIRWKRAWNETSAGGLRPGFGVRPPKLTTAQFNELCDILKEGQPWTPRAIHALIEDCYDITYHLGHLSRKFWEAGMNYAKPRPMDSRQPADAEDDREPKKDGPVVLGFSR